MDKIKEKWAILCGTGMETDYLTDVGIFDTTEKEIFDGEEEPLVEEYCGNNRASFPIKLTPHTKEILKDLIKELEII